MEKFKGYEIEAIMDATRFGLKKAVEQKLCSKLDGMLNTDDAFIVNDKVTIYYIKGLYSGTVAGTDMSDLEFVVFDDGAIGKVESWDL